MNENYGSSNAFRSRTIGITKCQDIKCFPFRILADEESCFIFSSSYPMRNLTFLEVDFVGTSLAHGFLSPCLSLIESGRSREALPYFFSKLAKIFIGFAPYQYFVCYLADHDRIICLSACG